MEEYDEDNRVAGSIPEFGAIFMTSLVTKKECFKRKIFALPSSKAEFVKHVKAGMVLFLFECNKRQLFGVYQASSDGAMDIVPHAFNYSGRRFPAQVCFTPIWYCDPLSEREFQDAIRENYFSAKKFNFGLSEVQVRRLLSLFNSRKLKKEIAPQPPAKAVVGVAGRDRRPVRDDRFELSERGFMEPTEHDELNPAVLPDYHPNALIKEDEVLIDDRVNTEGKVYPLGQEDFLAKRRRIDNVDRLLTNDTAEMYNYGALRPFHIDSPNDCLDEIRKLADARQSLTVERVRNAYQVHENRNTVLSSEFLNVRTADADRFMQRNRLFDEYNMDNGFASEHYGKPLDTSKHAIDNDRFLFDDSVQRKQNIHDIVKPVSADGNPSLCRQAMQVIEDHPCLMNRKLENRYHLDRDVSPFSAFDHSNSLLHKIRETTSGGKFPVNDRIESEPNFGACSVEEFSSANFSRPLHYGHRIINDRKYPIVEGRVAENMVDNISCSATSTRNAGYFESDDGRVVDDRRFEKSKGVDNEKDLHTHIGPVISLEYPSFSNQKRSLSSFSDKSLPERGLSQLNVAHNFGPSRATFDDATITRSTPYAPEHANFSHGFTASMAANQNSSLVRENPHRGSLEDFYLYKNRSSPYFMDSKSRSLDITPEFGNQSSLHHEATSSYLNSDFSMHVDPNASFPVNYRGSLLPKSSFSPRATSCENIEDDEGALFAYPSKSSEDHFAFDGNHPTASQHARKHVPRQELDMLAGKDFICSEAKDSSLGTYHPGRDLTSYENQYIRISSNMNRQVNHEISEAPHFDSNVNRRSVFTRLTSRQESQGGEDRDESDFDCHDCFMDATADEVIEMLRQSNNLSLRKLKKPRVVGQPKHGESAGDEKQVRSHTVINISAMEKKKLNDAHLANEESIDEVPKETRIMDFKRRRDTKKNLAVANTDPALCNKITGDNEEVKSPMKTSLKRKKLIRPVFGKIESATDTICSNKKLRVPGQILEKDDERSCEKAISIGEADMPNDNTKLNNVLVSHTHQSMDCNIKEHSNPEEQKDIEVHVLPSSSNELKEHKSSNVDLHIDSSCEAEMPNDNTKLNNVLVSDTRQSMDCNIKERSNPEEQKDIEVHVLPSSNNELKEHKTSIVGLHMDSSQALLPETTQRKSVGIQTAVDDILSKNMDSTASSLNLDESSPVGLERPRMLKRKLKIIRPKKTGVEPSQ